MGHAMHIIQADSNLVIVSLLLENPCITHKCKKKFKSVDSYLPKKTLKIVVKNSQKII